MKRLVLLASLLCPQAHAQVVFWCNVDRGETFEAVARRCGEPTTKSVVYPALYRHEELVVWRYDLGPQLELIYFSQGAVAYVEIKAPTSGPSL